jgi:hypothetical protein
MPNPEISAIRRLKEVVVDCKSYRFATQAAVAVSCLLSAITSLSAQDSLKSATEKWRPRDGLYASPGKNFDSWCGEYGDLNIQLSEKSISGHEWGCEINRLSETAADAIKLDMTCHDLNLAESLRRPDRNPEDRTFKEVIFLKRIDDKALFVRKTLNGKFKGPSWQADYCPDGAQQMYIEVQKRAEAEARYKVPEQLLNPKQWRPKDGIYATPGADFNDRCTKSGEIVVGLNEGAISSGKAECKVVGLMSTGQAAVSLTCSPEAGKQASSSKKKDGDANARKDPETLTADVIRMSRIDDNTFHMQKTVDRKFRDDGGPVSYCPDEAQRAYAARKAKK